MNQQQTTEIKKKKVPQNTARVLQEKSIPETAEKKNPKEHNKLQKVGKKVSKKVSLLVWFSYLALGTKCSAQGGRAPGTKCSAQGGRAPGD